MKVTKTQIINYQINLDEKEFKLLDQCLKYCLHRVNSKEANGIQRFANGEMVKKLVDNLKIW